MFIAAKTISYTVQTEQNHTVQTEQKTLLYQSEISSKIKQTTSEKLSNMLNNRTLKDFTQKLDPYKRNPSDSPLTTLNYLRHCYDRTSQLLQTSNFRSRFPTYNTILTSNSICT